MLTHYQKHIQTPWETRDRVSGWESNRETMNCTNLIWADTKSICNVKLLRQSELLNWTGPDVQVRIPIKSNDPTPILFGY